MPNGLQKQERAMSGYDVKLSGQAPYLPWAKIKGTYYYWDAKLGPDIKGNILAWCDDSRHRCQKRCLLG
jgi:hypothetical protein